MHRPACARAHALTHTLSHSGTSTRPTRTAAGASRTTARSSRTRTLKDRPASLIGCSRSRDIRRTRSSLRHYHTAYRRCRRCRRGGCRFHRSRCSCLDHGCRSRCCSRRRGRNCRGLDGLRRLPWPGRSSGRSSRPSDGRSLTGTCRLSRGTRRIRRRTCHDRTLNRPARDGRRRCYKLRSLAGLRHHNAPRRCSRGRGRCRRRRGRGGLRDSGRARSGSRRLRNRGRGRCRRSRRSRGGSRRRCLSRGPCGRNHRSGTLNDVWRRTGCRHGSRRHHARSRGSRVRSLAAWRIGRRAIRGRRHGHCRTVARRHRHGRP